MQSDGTFEATTLVLAVGEIRAVGVGRAGATSEFSAPFPASARQRIPARAGDGELHWVAVEGAERPVREALESFGDDELRAAWRWSADAGWQGWSPSVPEELNTLRTVRGGEALLLQLAPGPPRDFFSTESAAGVGAAIELSRGFNYISWTGFRTQAADALARLQREQPRLVSIVEQWDAEEQRWRVIWPEAPGAWSPPDWGAPVLRIRATRDGVWGQGP